MWKKIVLGVLILLSAGVGFGMAKVQSTLNHTLNQVTRDTDSILKDVDLSGIDVESDDEIINLLLVGDDYRKEDNYTASGLPDVMMIATIDKKHNTLKLTSLMRDMLVDMTTDGEVNRLNHSFSYGEGGVKNLYKTIAQNFNIKLDGYLKVNFNAFVKVINAVGGVEVELTQSEADYLNTTNYIKPKKYRTVKVGKQTLNGAQALGYCRIRKGGTVTVNGLTDDYGRTWRQRTVLSALFDKVKGMSSSEWIDIANKVFKSISTDLDNDTIMSYMKDVISMGTLQVHQLQIPYEGYYFSNSDEAYTSLYPKYSLVPTNGTTSEYDVSENARILKKFILKYDGQDEFSAE
ncbi:MAG: LCP family protein [Clostridiaceae bacterium]|nr:LCP family protein [Clostridiaceae bacterium]